MSSDKTIAPFTLGESAPVRTTWRTIIVVGAFAATAFGSWVLLRAQVESHAERLDEHTKRLEAVEARLATDHDILLEIRADVKALNRDRRPQP